MLHREPVDSILLLRLARGKVNAIDLELLQALETALDEAEAARGVVLTGTGTVFSAGVDLARVLEGGRAYLEAFLPAFSRVLRRLFGFPRPLVAAINGHALAGGYVLACAADYRVMADGGGRVGLPELAVGVPFPAAAVELVRSVVPGGAGHRLLLLGRQHEATEAAALGLVDELAAPGAVVTRAIEIARELAARPADAFRLTKASLREPALARMHAAESAQAGLVDVWAAEETLAAIRTHLERLRKDR
ncbi:MAG TPA: enoyl-CoA hydratase/isomerase family protein [Vicinamibacterales bacterium]|nr:enoyl-CoA hydratase/isomerase family protein [Vicinamibacterales bacterium]